MYPASLNSVIPFQIADMFPALPTGKIILSGDCHLRSCTISYPIVFCPSRRNGFIEFRRYNSPSSASSVIVLRASSKFPSIENTFAPWNIACASFPSATFPDGSTTAHLSPARAAYAESDVVNDLTVNGINIWSKEESQIFEDYKMIGKIRMMEENEEIPYEKILSTINFIPKITIKEKINPIIVWYFL